MQPTAPKTPRGIQEADVWAAADALLADGHKPTIEKVRQHMGRGSPNTVAPMLDAWFGTLGARLGLNQETQDLRNSVPTEVLEAAQVLWSHALQQAQEIAVQSLQLREEAAQAAQKQLEAQQAKLQQREEAMQQQKMVMDSALKLAQDQREDLSRRLNEMQQQLNERDVLLEKQRLEQAALRTAQEHLREQHSKELETAAQERQRLTEQFAGNERRMLADLDRSRQEVEKAKKSQQEAEQKAQARSEAVQTRCTTLEEELLAAQTSSLSAQQALALSKEHVQELKAMLKLMQAAATATTEGEEGDAAAAKNRGGRSLQRRALSERALRLTRK